MKMELIILKCYRIIGDELPVSLFILMMQVKTPASEPAGGCDRLLIIRRPAAESSERLSLRAESGATGLP